MPHELRVASGDITCQATLPEPRFDILDDDALERALFAALSPYGLRLGDMRVEGGRNFSEEHLSCSLSALVASVRLFLDRLEVQFLDVVKSSPDGSRRVMAEALTAVRATGSVSFKTYTFVIGLHGVIDGVATRVFLSRFLPPGPGALGTSIGSGGAFYYGPEGERLLASVTLDISGVVQDGLFLRTLIVLNGENVEPLHATDLAQAFFVSTLKAFDLSIETL